MLKILYNKETSNSNSEKNYKLTNYKPIKNAILSAAQSNVLKSKNLNL